MAARRPQQPHGMLHTPQRMRRVLHHLRPSSAESQPPLPPPLLVAPPAQVGDAECDIDTPALIVELDVFETNIRKMAALAASFGVALRPHFKMHKCPAVALRQIQHGAIGLCCQKVGEAEVMAAAGVRDILVSNEVVSASKLRRLCALAPGLDWLGVCADCVEGVDAIEAACAAAGVHLDVLVELDFERPEGMDPAIPFAGGFQRCGAKGPRLVEVAQRIAVSPHLGFGGLQAYYGKAQHIRDYEERRSAIESAAAQVRAALDALAAVGLSCARVSGAGTGTAGMEAATGLWTELQAGSYPFMDVDYGAIHDPGGATLHETDGYRSSLFVLTEVMSCPGPGRMVCDAGLKVRCAPPPPARPTAPRCL